MDQFSPNENLDSPSYPWTDETGDVDLTLLAENLRLAPWERAEKHYRARMLVQQLRRAGREFYGPALDDLAPAD
jgi:hypothetical protein